MANTKDVSEEIATALFDEFSLEREERLKKGFFKSFEKYLNEYFDFEDRSDFDTLLEKLKEEKKLKMLELGFFYHIITEEIGDAAVTLISIFSIMEAAIQNKFISFDQWLLRKIENDKSISFPSADKDSFKKAIRSFKKEYYKKHGSTESVRRFIDEYFCAGDKQLLIKSFQIIDESEEKCISFNSLKSDKKLNKIIEWLYAERSAFVHSGRFPQITDSPYRTIGCLKIKNTYCPLVIEISIHRIKKMFERAFMKYFHEVCA